MKPTPLLERGSLVFEIKLPFYDTQRDMELLKALTGANVMAAHGSTYHLDSRVKHFLETLLGLSTSCELSSLGLTQWPPQLVKTIRVREHKKAPQERGRILRLVPKAEKKEG